MKLQMKLVLVTTLFALCTAMACKKDETPTPTKTPAAATSCNGDLLCFKMDGTHETFNTGVKWVVTSNGNRVYWENGNQSAYENIEIDVKGTSTGTYDVSTGDAGFQYFKATGNVNIQATSGTIEVTAIDNTNNTISGKFTITATDQNNNSTHQITEGFFENVPK